MFARFKDLNNYFDEHKELIDSLHKQSQNRKQMIHLVKEDRFLYAARPFESFIGDCESCSHYMKSPYDFVEGGDCLLHHVSVGYGFICKDNDSEENIGWKEFERIKNEST